ncbi:hypothetical protein V6N11_060501 [Hibiscus sabdariffa]|uniref:Zinc knuckle CX2CX4HX4C domain-containing protein n=1 Tax=Hibiscus sabdariffa TaxID=183260 RepID=A0ABR2QQI1_9ROSI
MASESILPRLGDLTFTTKEQGVVITPSLSWSAPSDDSDLSLIRKVFSDKEVDENALIQRMKLDERLALALVQWLEPIIGLMRGIWWISCVWVVLNPAKPLRRCVFLGSLGFDSTLCHIQYERLPLFCHQCSIIGHPTSSCTLVQGDWLRATTPKSPFGNSRSRGRIRYHDKPIKESGFIQSAAKNASTSNFSNLGGTSSAVSVDVVAPIELESTAADSSTSGSALHEVPITVRPGLDHVATIQAPSVAVVADHELLVAAAADLAEPIAVAAESFVPFDMVGSLLAAVALLFDSDDGALSNVDPILPVIRNDVVLVVDLVDDQGKATSSIIAVNGHSGIPLTDNHVDPLLDFEAWLNQSP